MTDIETNRERLERMIPLKSQEQIDQESASKWRPVVWLIAFGGGLYLWTAAIMWLAS